ncbi:hypothetical protein [Nonomuraea sp. NPDC049480]|uniref:hypothetical protein n=1 Tax=Nonomuraea sp. NPDC049480 TaxID=3364353 RepID=UPI003789D00B
MCFRSPSSNLFTCLPLGQRLCPHDAGGHGAWLSSCGRSPPFIAATPSGAAVRDRLKGLTAQDETVLRLVGAHLGALASSDLAVRCRDGLAHSAQRWAERKRELTALSSARWAGAITKASHDQWALARRCQLAHIQSLEAGIATITRRLAVPVGQKGTKDAPAGYRSRKEWFAKSRRLSVLKDRLAAVRADWQAGRVHIVRGGKRLAGNRHHLEASRLDEAGWRARWEAARWFLQADGESGKRYGNETIRITPDGEVSLKLPAPLAGYANAPHGRYVLSARVRFAHRRGEWPAGCRRIGRWPTASTWTPTGAAGT